MELSFKELRKRDVVNIVDGRCFGHIVDLKLDFPKGKLTGIVVNNTRTNWFFSLFSKNQLFIDESNIIKIGGDVILVKVRCGNVCDDSINLSPPPPPPCPPPPCPPNFCGNNRNNGNDIQIDLSDY